nr:hypothetical protein [Tepidicella baoligensis]
MVRYLEVESRLRYGLVARIKIMAGMDVSKHRKPQDGIEKVVQGLTDISEVIAATNL